MKMEGPIARPEIRLQHLEPTGDQEKFIVQVESSSGQKGLPYDEFDLFVSGTRLAVWRGTDGPTADQVAQQLATMIVELHGTAAKFANNYFFNSDNTDSAKTVEEVVSQMQSERNLDKFIDHRDQEQ